MLRTNWKRLPLKLRRYLVNFNIFYYFDQFLYKHVYGFVWYSFFLTFHSVKKKIKNCFFCKCLEPVLEDLNGINMICKFFFLMSNENIKRKFKDLVQVQRLFGSNFLEKSYFVALTWNASKRLPSTPKSSFWIQQAKGRFQEAMPSRIFLGQVHILL